jgi:hypothetical protein
MRRPRLTDRRAAAYRRPDQDPLWLHQVKENDDVFAVEHMRVRKLHRCLLCKRIAVTIIVLLLVVMVAVFVFLQNDNCQRYINSRMFPSSMSFGDPHHDIIVYSHITGWYPWKFKVCNVHFRKLNADGELLPWAFTPAISVRIYSFWNIPLYRIANLHRFRLTSLILEESALGISTEEEAGPLQDSMQGFSQQQQQQQLLLQENTFATLIVLPNVTWPSLSAKVDFENFDILQIRIVNGSVMERLSIQLQSRTKFILPAAASLIDRISVSGKATVLGPGKNWEAIISVRGGDTILSNRLSGEIVMNGDAHSQTVRMKIGNVVVNLPTVSENCTVKLSATLGGNLQSFNALTVKTALLKGGPLRLTSGHLEMRNCLNHRSASINGALSLDLERKLHFETVGVTLDNIFSGEMNGVAGVFDAPTTWPLDLNMSARYHPRPGLTLDGQCRAPRCRLDIADTITDSAASLKLDLETDAGETRLTLRLWNLLLFKHNLGKNFTLFVGAHTRCVPWYRSASCMWTLQLNAPDYGQGNVQFRPSSRTVSTFSVSGSTAGRQGHRRSRQITCDRLSLDGTHENITLVATAVRAIWQPDTTSPPLINSARVEVNVQFAERLWQARAQNVGYAQGSLEHEVSEDGDQGWVLRSERGHIELQPFFHETQIEPLQWHMPQTLIYYPQRHRLDAHFAAADDHLTVDCTDCMLDTHACEAFRVHLVEKASVLVRMTHYLRPNLTKAIRLARGQVNLIFENNNIRASIANGTLETDNLQVTDVDAMLHWDGDMKTTSAAFAVRAETTVPWQYLVTSEGSLDWNNRTISVTGDTVWLNEHTTASFPGGKIETQLTTQLAAMLPGHVPP